MTQAGGNQEENKQMNRNKWDTLSFWGKNEKLKQQRQKQNSDQIVLENKRRLKLSIIFQ